MPVPFPLSQIIRCLCAYKTASFARDKQMLVDFVAIKPAKHEVKLFRIGMGGPERDRGYSYNA